MSYSPTDPSFSACSNMNRIIEMSEKKKPKTNNRPLKGLLTKMGANQNDTDNKKASELMKAMEYVKMYRRVRQSDD
tara:strand:- start:2001 stop:2228 length:228 start_codon:yes stop_codon:yes gene_type:complete